MPQRHRRGHAADSRVVRLRDACAGRNRRTPHPVDPRGRRAGEPGRGDPRPRLVAESRSCSTPISTPSRRARRSYGPPATATRSPRVSTAIESTGSAPPTPSSISPPKFSRSPPAARRGATFTWSAALARSTALPAQRKSWRPRYCRRERWLFVGEPSRLEVITAHKGLIIFELTLGFTPLRIDESMQVRRLDFAGKAAHSSTPALGVNAIEIALEAMAINLKLNLAAISGGTAVNVVPARCDVVARKRRPARPSDRRRGRGRELRRTGSWRLSRSRSSPR